MKAKNIVVSLLLTGIVLGIYGINETYEKNYTEANTAYAVYLNGERLGLIQDENKLYNIINDEQEELKAKYAVNNVYPPSGFEIVEVNTFDDNYVDENKIYEHIAELDDFMLKGYIITIKFPDEDTDEDGIEEQFDDLVINVLDRQVFEDAINDFLYAFISADDINKYVNEENEKITDIGSMIEKMYFNETITIKEGFISSNEKIFTNTKELSQYLLFGPNAQMINYTVKLGDDIESISDEHKLNPQEFLVANPIYRQENTILKVGETVNVTVLNPILTFVYDVYQIEDVTVPFNQTTVTDNAKPYGYSEITKAGINGLVRNYKSYQVINGEQSQEVKIDHFDVLQETVDQVTTVGPKKITTGGSGAQTILDGDWTWPTNVPCYITSKYRWRSLNGVSKMHEGIDISGTGGEGSPIYAIGDGEVVIAQKAEPRGSTHWSNGTYVVIRHANEIYSAYLHLNSFNVTVGQHVTKGQRIASMGHSGYATGAHLHLGLWKGMPYSGTGATSMDPQKAIPAFKKFG